MGDYLRPATLAEGLAALRGGDWQVLAGGTDLYPMTKARALTGPVLDIADLTELRGITATDAGLRIGACTSWAEIAAASHLPPALDALREAAREVGGWQVQNAGTIGGNLCNASPAADGAPPLLTLEARVELASAGGTRHLPLAAFLTGPRQTARQPDELLTAIHLPAAALAGRSCFLKLGARRHLVISIAMVAARIVTDGGRITDAALAVGACAATARRLPVIEAALIGQPVTEAAQALDPAGIAAALAPIDDLRASAAYRQDAAAEMIRRAVARLTGGPA